MSRPHHQVSGETFAALASGRGGDDALELIIQTRRSRAMLMLRAILELAGPTGPLADAYALLTGLHEHGGRASAAVERLLGYPSVGGWATQTLAALQDSTGNDPDLGGMSRIAAAAAVLSGTDAVIEVPARAGTVVLPCVGVTSLPDTAGDRLTVRSGPDGGVLAAGRSWVRVPSRPLPVLGDGLFGGPYATVIDHIDPYCFPGQQADWLTEHVLARWRAVLAAGWAELAGMPWARTEISRLIRAVVPLPWAGGPRSITSSAAHGSIALTEPVDALSCAETLIHETQHTKSHAIADLVPMIDGADRPRWYSPWRDDPRPLAGLLHAAYAHLAVIEFRDRSRSAWVGRDGGHAPAVEYARTRGQTEEALTTLAGSGRLTDAGTVFVDGMARALARWEGNAVPPEVEREAVRLRAWHRATWHDGRSGSAP